MSLVAAVVSGVLLGLVLAGAVCVMISQYKGYQRRVFVNFEKQRKQISELQDRLDLQESMVKTMYQIIVSNTVDVQADTNRKKSARPRESDVRQISLDILA